MNSHSRITAFFLLIVLIIPALTINAQEMPIVYGIFFYSPTCPHCHQVIQNDWPGIQAEFGDQLRVLFVDATTQAGNQLMNTARAALNIEATGVPMLIIGENVMIGGNQIPAMTPLIVRDGLAQGGIGYPPIPGIDAIFDAAVQRAEAEAAAPAEAESDPAALETSAPTPLTVTERLAADPIANGFAILILALLAISLLTTPLALQHSGQARQTFQKLHHAALIVIPLLGLGLAVFLIPGWDNQPLVLALAAAEFIVFFLLFVAAINPNAQNRLARWSVPLIVLAGLGVAGYLAAIEVTQSEAVCGLVGNCNVVQSSPYAQVFGVPIGVIGIVGYLAILVLWGIKQFTPISGITWLLRAVVLFGALFSTYLTFLEPFVIGATCLWCLSSAVIMLFLLWKLFPEIQVVPPAVGTPQPVTS